MKRLLTLILALLMTAAVFCAGGAMNYAHAEGENDPETAEPADPYLGLWTFTGLQDGDEYISFEEMGEKRYLEFLPSGAIYCLLIDGEEAEDDYLAYVAGDDNTLIIFEGDDPIPCTYDPETGIIRVEAGDDESVYTTFLQRVTEEPLPDIRAMVDHSQEEQEFNGYQIKSEDQAMDLVEFIAIMDEDPDDYYYLSLQPDGTGYMQLGSEELGGDILWNDTEFIAVGNEDAPAPYTRENGHLLMDIDGTIMEFAPVGEVQALIAVIAWNLENAPAQIPEDMEGTWELTRCSVYGFELTPEQMDTYMTFILKLNGTAVLYTKDAAPAGYRLSPKDETTWALSSGGVELFELKYDGSTLTLSMMGVDMIFEKTED